MRAVLTNFGSTGSVHPYLALAVELQRHGHQPIMALSPYFKPLAERLGLQFAAVGPDLKELQQNINEAMMDMPESAGEISALFAPLAEALPQMFDDLRAACRDADVLISGPVQPAGRMVHEITSIPFVTVQNVHFSSGGTIAFQQATASIINPFRAQFGLPPLRDPLMDANSSQLVLYAMSRHVRKPLLEWPPHYHMTGYFFLDMEERQPDPALLEFLAAGEPPVVLTFGSMTHDDPGMLTELLLDAVRIAGCRAIIQHGWSGLAQRRLPPNVYAAGFMSHSWLFPRAACVIHHGGSGTTAAVFRAGVPSVFVPHAWEQDIWAELGRELGCAKAVIPYPELTAERLGKTIAATLSDPHTRTAAATLGEKIRSEPGVRLARQLIEELISRIGLYEQARPDTSLETEHGDLRQKVSRRKQHQQKQRARAKV
ncbi:MAG: glycosyltransferase [Acidobacteria bacterium]|nr:glycosyltransferase [Acidobacteriota bacterium]